MCRAPPRAIRPVAVFRNTPISIPTLSSNSKAYMASAAPPPWAAPARAPPARLREGDFGGPEGAGAGGWFGGRGESEGGGGARS
jgi:hypothetical protein